MFAFNLERINNELGSNYTSDKEVVDFLESMRDYFRYHNKNLTKAQEMFIQGFINIVDGIEGR